MLAKVVVRLACGEPCACKSFSAIKLARVTISLVPTWRITLYAAWSCSRKRRSSPVPRSEPLKENNTSLSDRIFVPTNIFELASMTLDEASAKDATLPSATGGTRAGKDCNTAGSEPWSGTWIKTSPQRTEMADARGMV